MVENALLRQQVIVLRRQIPRARLTPMDRGQCEQAVWLLSSLIEELAGRCTGPNSANASRRRNIIGKRRWFKTSPLRP